MVHPYGWCAHDPRCARAVRLPLSLASSLRFPSYRFRARVSWASRASRLALQARSAASAQARKRVSAASAPIAQSRKRANLWILNFFFEFRIFRLIFRPIFRTKCTQIFNTPPTCLITPYWWSNHLALAQLAHKWPRNYQNKFFQRIFRIFEFPAGISGSIFGSNIPKFPNLL